jgi:hypothetical protein
VTEQRGLEGFGALEADWRRLYDEMQSPEVWHSYEAHAVYVAHLCPAPEQFRCLALSDGTEVRAILPLEERVERGRVGRGLGLALRVWGMPLGPGWIVNDAIGPDGEARRALIPAALEHLRRDPARPAVLDVGRSRAESTMWDGLDGLGRTSRFVFTDREEYVFPTDTTFDEFTGRMAKKARGNIRRAMHKAETLEGATFVRAVTPEELLSEYECFLAVEASGWKGEQGSAVREYPDLVAFYRALTQQYVRDGHVEIHSLYMEGRCIASGFWVYSGRECALLKCGYDEEYARYSPGRLMTHRTLEWCCDDQNVDLVSLMSNAPWMTHWRPEANAWRRAFISLRPVSGPLTVGALRLWYGPVRSTVRRVRKWRMDRDVGRGARRGSEAVAHETPKD